MEERVYATRLRDVEDLRRRLLSAWNDLDQSVIDTAVMQWRARLRACVAARGGQFEYKL
jgi:hypothetical protein